MGDRYSPQRRSGRDMYEFGRGQQQQHGDSYRPGNFSFQMPTGQGRPSPRFPDQPLPSRPPPTQRQSGPPPSGPRRQRQQNDHGYRGNRNQRGGRRGRGGRGGRFQVAISDRPLLRGERVRTPERMEGMTEGDAKFRNVEDMSDSDEEDMQMDSDMSDGDSVSDQDGIDHHTSKKRRLEQAPPGPKWSNPDPYTALPPPDESLAKRKDVVKMIRKAKASGDPGQSNAGNGEDFISFNFDEDPAGQADSAVNTDSEDSSVVEVVSENRAPAGSRFSHLDNLHPDRDSSRRSTKDHSNATDGVRLHVGNLNYSATEADLEKLFAGFNPTSVFIPENPKTNRSCGYGFVTLAKREDAEDAIAELQNASLLGRSVKISQATSDRDSGSKHSSVDVHGPPPPAPADAFRIDSWPPPPPPKDAKDSRKRGPTQLDLDDEEDSRSDRSSRRRKRGAPVGMNIVSDWRAMPNGNSTPWIRARKDQASFDISTILHHEILDLYDYLKPQQFENYLRERMVNEIQKCVRSAISGANVYYFGSFAAGLYLPEGDMDLVVLSKRYLDTGEPSMRQSFNALRKFGDALQRNDLVKPGSMAIISKARVPLVKYVDRRTGLRVDISFENESGVKANKTYTKWKAEFPAMSILVMLVKQFLLMRRVSDVHTGGLGGFSTTCLIISLMQNMPHLTTGNMGPMQNLGEILMTFLDYYGNKFNLEKTGIELDPPKLFQKKFDSRAQSKDANKAPKLCIIDPNDLGNDISRGSFRIADIFKMFSSAFDSLQARLNDVKTANGRDTGSVLGSLYAGDYDSHYQRQRQHMHRLYTESHLHTSAEDHTMAAAFLDTVECRSHAKVLQALARHGYNRASHGSGTHPEQVAYGYKPAPIAYGYNVTTQAHGHNPRLPPDYGHAVPPPPSFAMRDHPPQHGPHNPHG